MRRAARLRKSSPLKARLGNRKPEENPPAKKKEKEENKSWIERTVNKTEAEEDNNFKLADSPHFQTGAVIVVWFQSGEYQSIGHFFGFLRFGFSATNK